MYGNTKALQANAMYINKKTFTKWVNGILATAHLEINDLYTDLADGKILMKLLEILSGEHIGKPNKGLLRVQKLENLSRCFRFLSEKVRIGNIGPEDIVDGNHRLILGLIWIIILKYHILEEDEDDDFSEKKSAKDALLLWCQRKTAGYPRVQITNFTSSWRDGMGFNALIHALRPDLIDFDSLYPNDNIGNLNNAFTIAASELGIPDILDAKDIDVEYPDEKSIITYIAAYQQYFAKMQSENPEGESLTKDAVQEDIGQEEKYQSKFISRSDTYHQDQQKDLEDPTEDLLQHMKTEMTTVRHARGIVVGCGGAGKTTLLYSLMGKSFDEIKEIKSTRGLQVYEHIFTVKEGSLIATENLKVTPLIRVPKSLLTKKNTKSEEADGRMIDDTDDLTKTEGIADIPEIEGTDDFPEEIPDEEITEAVVEKKDTISLPSVFDENPKEEKATTTVIAFQHNASESQADDTIVWALSPEVIKKILDAQENEISVSMIDFAGQFAYYACHQIYMRSSAFYILVMDMKKSFKEVVIDEEEDQKGSVFSTWKHKDYVEFWLNSIKSFGGPDAPVLIVATHMEGKTEDDIDDYFTTLWRSLPVVDRTWLSNHHSEENEFAFELININEGERTQKLQSLKNSLVDVVSNKLDNKIPVRSSWAFLEHLLRDSGKPIISYKEIQEMNRKVPEQYRLESEEEIPNFLTFFHDHGILLYFKGEATRTHAILSLQWFSNAFSRLIADKGHVNKDCKRRHIKEWELFNQTGELNSTLVDALWKDEKAKIPNEQSYTEYKTELMSYMERLRMLVSIGDTAKAQSWYVPCMNKKPFTKEIIKANLACSSILCFRFTSFAIFVFYRLIAYCMSSLNLKVVPDKRDICLFQTVAVFEYKNHTVLLGICDKDIQVQVVTHSLDIKTEVSCEVGNSIHKALDELTETFENTDLSFQRGYKCQMIFCDQNDTSFTPEEELCKLRIEEIQCSCCPMGEKHLIKVNQTRRFWEQQKMGEDKEGNFHCLDDRLNRPPTDKQLKIVSGHIGADFQLLGIQLGLGNATIQQIRMDYQNYGVITQIFQMLCAWKEKEGKQATVKEFLDAIEAHGGEIDIEKIKSAFNL